MAKFVPDINTNRWVLIAPKRWGRPDRYKNEVVESNHKCVFCEGNESMTPPEKFRIGEGAPDEPGWQVRVVPNLYPITDIHEVIIHSPDHMKDLEDLPAPQVEKIFLAFKERYNYHRRVGQVLIFTNHGKLTGASQIHPHSQLVVIPEQIKLDCLSLEPIRNVISDDKYFTSFCPEFSQWPYEVWLAPKNKHGFFGDINEEELISLVFNLQSVLNKMRRLPAFQSQMHADEFAYNLYIYPLQNWYLRIIPRLMTRAGFELGTGILLNIKDPEEAATELAEV